MLKKLLNLFLSLALIFISSSPIFANDSDYIKDISPEITNYSSSDDKARIPNAIPIKITANSNGTGCKVYVGNVGIDSLDLVTVTVKATGHKAKTQTAKVIPVAGKTFSFNLPMIKANTVYDVTVKIKDGNKTKTKIGQAKLQYTESKLSGVWHKGTYSTRAESLNYHFNKHKGEVSGTSNMVGYVNKAISYRSELAKSTSNVRISTGKGKIPSKKYKHLKDGRFIILTNSGREILSFGR